MKIVRFALRTVANSSSYKPQPSLIARTIFTNTASGDGLGEDSQTPDSFESASEFQSRIFGRASGNKPMPDAFFQQLDKIDNAKKFAGFGGGGGGGGGNSWMDSLDESSTTLSDGLDGKLKTAATNYFEWDEEEVGAESYSFRPDVTFRPASTYTLKDLDLTKPGIRKPVNRIEFETTTAEVLRKADFRNVRFLANFITESGIIHKRVKTGISAKAQRKIAREIKTARAFGLMPFTTMGTKSFIAGKTMESRGTDFEYESFGPVEDALEI